MLISALYAMAAKKHFQSPNVEPSWPSCHREAFQRGSLDQLPVASEKRAPNGPRDTRLEPRNNHHQYNHLES